MNTKIRTALMLALVVLGGIALAAAVWATPGNAPLAQGGSPPVVAYQGEVRVADEPYTGTGYFKFAVVNATGNIAYWSNDGSSAGGSEPATAVQLTVNGGLFGVLLGDTTLEGMTQTLTADVFSQPDRYLRVWFSSNNITFNHLTPDTRIAAVPYALQAQEALDAGAVDGYEGAALEESAEIVAGITAHAAISDAHHARYTDAEAWAAVRAADGPGSGLDADTVDGMHAGELGAHYQNVVIVAKSGGDYTGVQAAIDSITGTGAANAYLVWIAPGVYSETVTMKPFVHLQGAGQQVTIITSTAGSGSDWPPAQATLMLASDAGLRDLTVGNGGASETNAALLAITGTARTQVADVTVQSLGPGQNNFAVFLDGSGTSVTLQQVTALAENGESLNAGLINHNGAQATVHGGVFTGRGGAFACGISNSASTTTLNAENVTALGENGSSETYGLNNTNGAAAVLHGGSSTARGGVIARGILSVDSGTTLDAIGVTVLGEDGSNINYGLDSNAVATLRGGVFTGHGGISAYGINNARDDTILDADNVTVLGEDGSDTNFGLDNSGGATAVLRNGSFTGRGGQYSRGIGNAASGTTLEADNATALGENASTHNFGLDSSGGAMATLRGGAFTGNGGTAAWGIFNTDGGTTVEAGGVTATGNHGSDRNFGLNNGGSARAILRGGSFTGNGGVETWGILNADDGTTLEADDVVALAEGDNETNFGLDNSGSAQATLRGGSCTARGGTSNYGIFTHDEGTTLEASNVAALAEHGSFINFGIENHDNGVAILRNGSFTGRGGTDAFGIYNTENGAALEASNVTALGEAGNNFNHGLFNNLGAAATLRGGVFTGRGGTETGGINNADTGTILEAENVTARGENASSINRGMINENGATATADNSQFTGGAGNGLLLDGGVVSLGVCQLDGDATRSSGTLICFQVYDGSYNAYTCP